MVAHYQSVADDLRRRIESGEFRVGDRLPAETQLATRYRVSVPTLRLSLELLQAEGRVEKQQGRGNFVRHPRARTVYDSERQATQSPPLQVSVEVDTVNATSLLSTLLKVRRGALLTEFDFISVVGTSVQGMVRLYVPQTVARLGPPEGELSPWGDNVRESLAAAGVHVASTVERVTSRLPSVEEKEVFRSTTPVLAVERTSTDDSGRVVEVALLTLPGDRAEAVFTAQTRAEALEEAR
ncbi:GntR family transcriptional regulator [Streptomyces rectiverticillatus]|uniref:GntR family transcriptional regulator n=1 Tax=Streptomyces rectiverticillatus TaxID=173860 RepID=UPI0015C38419|nr:GntR family transcriptional regulator [Streptomyces rectiverticillatus]